MIGRLVPHQRTGQTARFVVNKRYKLLLGHPVALGHFLEQPSNLARNVRVYLSGRRDGEPDAIGD
jgi:hypothetical protein